MDKAYLTKEVETLSHRQSKLETENDRICTKYREARPNLYATRLATEFSAPTKITYTELQGTVRQPTLRLLHCFGTSLLVLTCHSRSLLTHPC